MTFVVDTQKNLGFVILLLRYNISNFNVVELYTRHFNKVGYSTSAIKLVF